MNIEHIMKQLTLEEKVKLLEGADRGFTVNGNSVRGVWQHQYPIGSGRILGYGMLS